MTTHLPPWLGKLCRCLLLSGLQLCSGSIWGQAAKSPAELQSQLDGMQTRLEIAQQQIDQDHAELQQLRKQLEALASQSNPAVELQQAVAGLEEQQALNQSQIQVHEQEKVESASKYPVKLHGLLLFNAGVANGALDQPRLPAIALSPGAAAANGSLTASGSQTILGLEATGPTLWGARTYGNVDTDFSGGLYGASDYSLRLRTAVVELAWPHTTVQGGIAPLLLTPEYATSYFSIAQPAFSWSGALWVWLPQLSMEHRFQLSDHQQLSLQAAVADFPDAYVQSANGLGAVSAAERSRYPGSEARTAWHGGKQGDQTIGVGGYWSPHSYAGRGVIDAWAGTLDWKALLPGRLQWTGEIYRGAALGGLNAGAFKDSVLLYSSSSVEPLAGLKDAGGWSQLKYKPSPRFEFNLAFGLDNADNAQLRNADLAYTDPYSQLARNQTGFANIIFRPTSSIILSGEYRRIRSWPTEGPGERASRFGLAAGYAF